jgi:spore coat protein U-like protein
MPIVSTQLRAALRFVFSALLLSALFVAGIASPLPARAATTGNWQCTPELEALAPVPLSAETPAGQRTDRRTVSLNCTYETNGTGNALVTLCLAAPLGLHPDGVVRQVKSVTGDSRVHYSLTAEPGNVPDIQPFPSDTLSPVLKPLYTVAIPGDAPGVRTFRHQFKLVTEFETLTLRGLDPGDYADMLSGFVASIHDGDNCGMLLWGAPRDPLGELGNLAIAASLAPQCGFLVNTNLAFGVASISVAGHKAQGSMTLVCLTNLPNVRISMGPGNAPSTSSAPVRRQMQRSDGKAFIPYLILKPDGTEWSQVGSIIPGTPLDVPGLEGAMIGIGGMIPADAPMPPTGDYSDAVVITLEF